MNDSGFGIVHADSLTPRPTYNWLQELQFNRYINHQPVRALDVEIYLPDRAHPVGYDYSNKWRNGILIIHDATVDSLCPTVIKLTPSRQSSRAPELAISGPDRIWPGSTHSDLGQPAQSAA